MILGIIFLSVLFIVLGALVTIVLKHKFFKKNYKRNFRIVIVGIVALYLFIVYSVYTNSTPNKLVIEDDHIEFTGSYGVKIKFKDIKNIQQTTLLPEIDSRVDGFSLAGIRKGSFKISSGEEIYLLINGDYRPILKITNKNQEKIYFSSAQENIKDEFEKLQNIFSYQKK